MTRVDARRRNEVFLKLDTAPPGKVDELVSLVSAAPASLDELESLPNGAAREYRRVAYWIALTDCVAFLAAFAISHVVRFGLSSPSGGSGLLMAVGPLVCVVIFATWGLYSLSRLAPAEEFRRLLAAVSVGIGLVMTAFFWFESSLAGPWFALSWLLSMVLVLATRQTWHSWIGSRKAEGRLTFRTLVVGTNGEAEDLVRTLRSRGMGFWPIGVVTGGNGGTSEDRVPVLGDVEGIQETIRRTGADCVFVASSSVTTDQMRTVTRAARREGAEIRVTASLEEAHAASISAQHIAGLMTISLRPTQLTRVQAVLKRMTDVAVSFPALVLLSPLLAASALAVKLSSTGPVLFRQERIGKRGRPFTLLKLRTMVVGADAMLAELMDQNVAEEPLFKVCGDPRVTRVGKFLRRWNIDELPQLVNVLRGDMSLVGPRPPLPREVATYDEWHLDRLEAQPGITGLWQVSDRTDLSFDDYVRLDLFYIENWSLAYDLFLIVRTVPVMIARRGDY